MADTLLEKIKKIKSMETPIESGTGLNLLLFTKVKL